MLRFRGLWLGLLAVLAGALTANPMPAHAATAAPRTTAPFVYTANHGRNDVSQFAAPAAGHGALRPLSPGSVPAGSFPIEVTVSPDGHSAYVLNTNGNSISQYTIDPATGRLTAKSPATVPTGRGPGAVVVSPDGKHAYAVNGSGNSVSEYTVGAATGKLSRVARAPVAAGKSPDAMAFSPDGRHAYVTTFGAKTSTVRQYAVSRATGRLSPLSPAALTVPGVAGAVVVPPDGRHAYVLVTGGVAQFAVSRVTGKLSPLSPAVVAGAGLNGMAISPDGRYAYGPDVADRTVSQYRISRVTGKLSGTPLSTAASGRGPQAIALSADGRSAYVANENDGTVTQYTIDPVTGRISPKSPAAVRAASGSESVAVAPDADASVRVRAPASARTGAKLTYTIKVADGGPSPAWRVTLTDHLPRGARFRMAAGGRCSGPGAGHLGGTVRCVLGTVASGRARSITVTVVVPARPGVISNAVRVTSVTPDPVAGNNAATAKTRVRRQAPGRGGAGRRGARA